MRDRLMKSLRDTPDKINSRQLRAVRDQAGIDSLLIFIRNPIPMWIQDLKSLQFFRVNRAAQKQYGYSKLEFLNLSPEQLYFPEDLSQLRHCIELVIKNRRPITKTWNHRTNNGNTILVECTYQVISYMGQDTMFAVVNDITKKRHFEQAFAEADKRYRSIFDNAVEGIYQRLPSGRFLHVNPAFAKMLGFDSPDEFCSSIKEGTSELYVNPELREQHKKNLEKYDVLKGLEFEVFRKDRSKIWICVNVRTVRGKSGRVHYYEGTAEDITQRKLAEECLQALNIDLENKAQELARSNSELQQFAYAASHDLQEPLRMISSYLNLVSKRYLGKLDQDADEFIHYAIDGAKRMKGLIDDLLTYSKVGRSDDLRGMHSLTKLIEEALQNLDLSIQENKAKITWHDLPEEIYASGPQVILLFQNLIGNAIKFHSDNPPQITVSARQENNEWLFKIEDNGIGLDLQYSERIFRLFQRLHNRDLYPGTGVGLALCKKIIESHGGRIWVESKLGLGSSFYFTLPIVLPTLYPTE